MHCPIGIMGKDFKEDKKKKGISQCFESRRNLVSRCIYTQQLGK